MLFYLLFFATTLKTLAGFVSAIKCNTGVEDKVEQGLVWLWEDRVTVSGCSAFLDFNKTEESYPSVWFIQNTICYCKACHLGWKTPLN